MSLAVAAAGAGLKPWHAETVCLGPVDMTEIVDYANFEEASVVAAVAVAEHHYYDFAGRFATCGFVAGPEEGGVSFQGNRKRRGIYQCSGEWVRFQSRAPAQSCRG